ncbi:MAG: transcription elongation factor GreA [Acidimicrobiia bacterium]
MPTHRVSAGALERLRAEHLDLTTRGRIEVAQRIGRAREMGDLKENGDYHAAKDDQGHMEARIRQIEAILENHEVVEVVDDGKVAVGCTVTVLYDGDSADQSERYLICHLEEQPADAGVQVMSPTSPLGAALLGRAAGDTVSYKAPNGTLKVKIVAIEACA